MHLQGKSISQLKLRTKVSKHRWLGFRKDENHVGSLRFARIRKRIWFIKLMFTSITDDYEPVETGQVHPNRWIFFSKSISECALLLAQCKIKFALKYHLTKAQTSWNIQRSLILKFTFPKFISAFSFFPIGLRRDKKVSQGRSIANQKDIN